MVTLGCPFPVDPAQAMARIAHDYDTSRFHCSRVQLATHLALQTSLPHPIRRPLLLRTQELIFPNRARLGGGGDSGGGGGEGGDFLEWMGDGG